MDAQPSQRLPNRWPNRWHDLDAVRAFALILGVAFHGAMSFMTPRIWIIDDPQHSAGLNIVFYVLHMFRMTTFFVLAGFFARLLMQKRGALGFARNRLMRVALPMIIFWVPVFSAIVAALIIANPLPPGATAAPTPPLTAATFPLTHLWFLYVLLIFYAAALALKGAGELTRLGGPLGRLLDGATRLLTRLDLVTGVLILPAAAALYLAPSWSMWFGVPTPDTGLMPNLPALAAYGTAFAFGWQLHRAPELIDRIARRWWVYGLSAILGTVLCLNMVGMTPVLTPTTGREHPLYLLCYLLTGWSWSFALIGAARTFLHAENPVIRYLSDASYWIYIVHLPLILAMQILVRGLNWPAEAKYALVILVTFGVSLLSYALLVRYSFIGAILNGRKRRARRVNGQPQEDFA
jgi:glucan biosynthesis protein C